MADFLDEQPDAQFPNTVLRGARKKAIPQEPITGELHVIAHGKTVPGGVLVPLQVDATGKLILTS